MLACTWAMQLRRRGGQKRRFSPERAQLRSIIRWLLTGAELVRNVGHCSRRRTPLSPIPDGRITHACSASLSWEFGPVSRNNLCLTRYLCDRLIHPFRSTPAILWTRQMEVTVLTLMLFTLVRGPTPRAATFTILRIVERFPTQRVTSLLQQTTTALSSCSMHLALFRTPPARFIVDTQGRVCAFCYEIYAKV